MSVVREKDPAAVSLGTRGAFKRWGPRRVIRLDDVDPAVADAVRALVAADQAARAARNEAASGVETLAAETTNGTSDAFDVE